MHPGTTYQKLRPSLLGVISPSPPQKICLSMSLTIGYKRISGLQRVCLQFTLGQIWLNKGDLVLARRQPSKPTYMSLTASRPQPARPSEDSSHLWTPYLRRGSSAFPGTSFSLTTVKELLVFRATGAERGRALTGPLWKEHRGGRSWRSGLFPSLFPCPLHP